MKTALFPRVILPGQRTGLNQPRISALVGMLVVLLINALLLATHFTAAAAQQDNPVYANEAEARQAGPDFDVQGEYTGTIGGAAGQKIGVQVIALGDGHFQAVLLPGGLPGAGWDEKSKILCQGRLENGRVNLEPAEGSRHYMAGPAEQFSATRKFPPDGQSAYRGGIADGRVTGQTETSQVIEAAKIERKSPTLGMAPPEGAVVLLPYAPGTPPSLAAWSNPKWKALPDGSMQVTRRGGEMRTEQSFSGAWTLHVEFRSPFQPTARSQGRGNSGVFPPGGREVQVLDSFGLDGLANECGGIYASHAPRVNMCRPPLSWQTFDITYHPAQENQQAWYRVSHNGVVIHEKVELGGTRSGPLRLQDHGNPVSYRNIWISRQR